VEARLDIRARLARLIGIRVVVGTLLLGWATLIQLSRPGTFPVDPFFFLIGVTYALSIASLATLRGVERFPWLVDLQLATDAILVSGFIGLTGGIVSYFSSLYLLPIIAASIISFRRGAFRVAVLSGVLYLGLVTAQYLALFPEWLGGDAVELPGRQFAQYTIAINLSGFTTVALLSGSLAERLRHAQSRLRDASHEIQDLRAFNEYVIDGLLSGLVTTDADCRVLTFNRAASAITGIPREQAVGPDAVEVLQLPSDLRSRLETLFQTRSLRVEFDYRTGEGRQLDVGLMVTMIALPNGRNGYLFTFQDVTELRRLERTGRLQQRLAAVGEMAAGIAHEIRNPLAAMSGSIQVLRQELSLSDDQAQLMDIVLRESERLNDTIRSFLAYARPQKFSIANLDLSKVVRDTALLLRNSSEAGEGHVVDVMAPPQPVWFEADENQIRQIVWNIASNGLRAMRNGGRLLLTVATESGSDRDEVILSVKDEGHGIPPEELDNIFQPFRSSFDKGTGLGLAIVHRIVSDYGGAIQVSSVVGTGTTVSVRLPVRTPASVASPEIGPARGRSAS
jgi:two-component system, NtrC family, sensor histidine kinase PilS